MKGASNRKRNRQVSTSYNNRGNQNKLLHTIRTTRAGDLNRTNKMFLDDSQKNLAMASGQTLHLSTPKSDLNFDLVDNSLGTIQYTNPVVNQSRLVLSHRNMMVRTNVGQFIKDHGLGKRRVHGKVKGRESRTTALDTINPLSETGSSLKKGMVLSPTGQTKATKP